MTFHIRDAVADDADVILTFVRELADYEKALHAVEASVETVRSSLFGDGAVAKAIICEKDGAPAGFAIWFYSYSTWLAKKGLYLEDLYVTPQHRGAGAGRALLTALARIAVDNDCRRFEWSVLDWNMPAIKVYEAIGAEPQDGWTRYRLADDRLRAFADL